MGSVLALSDSLFTSNKSNQRYWDYEFIFGRILKKGCPIGILDVNIRELFVKTSFLRYKSILNLLKRLLFIGELTDSLMNYCVDLCFTSSKERHNILHVILGATVSHDRVLRK